jgi:antitoxin HicB
MLRYPVKLESDNNGTILVTFPDVPEATTYGDDEAEALMRAADALETALAMYIEDRQRIPAPSHVKRGQRYVVLPLLAEAKLKLYVSMRADRVSKSELARRLNWHLPQVDRILDLNHRTRLDAIERAFQALGKRLDLSVEDAA